MGVIVKQKEHRSLPIQIVQTSLKYPGLRFRKKKIMNFTVKRSIRGGEKYLSGIIMRMRFLFRSDGVGTGRIGGAQETGSGCAEACP